MENNEYNIFDNYIKDINNHIKKVQRQWNITIKRINEENVKKEIEENEK